MGFERIHGTYAICLLNEKQMILNSYFVQFSFKEPWLYPHKEERFNNGSWLCGWLFFYFGNILARGDK